MKDGWHEVSGYKVYVESGKVLRGISGNGNNQKTVYPYRYSRKLKCMNECIGITIDAFRAGVRRETITME